MIENNNVRVFCGFLLGCAAVTLVGCSGSSDTTAAPIGTSASAPAVASTASTASTTAARFVAIAPSDADLSKMNLNYHTFTPAADNSYFGFVPLPPKSGDVTIGINAAGTYSVTLIDAKCAFDVQMTPSEGVPFVLNATAPTHQFTLTKSGQLKSAMNDTAANNYSCNVNLAPI